MSYSPEWIPGTFVLLIALLIVPPFAMIALLILAPLVLAILLALAGAIAATPYLLFRSLRSRWAQHVAGRNAEPMRQGLNPVPSKKMSGARREYIEYAYARLD